MQMIVSYPGIYQRKGRGQDSNGLDRAQAGSRYSKELDFVHRAPFVVVVFFFRSEEGSYHTRVYIVHR